MSFVLVCFFVLIIFAATCFFGKFAEKMSKKCFNLLFGGIVLLGFLLRLWTVIKIPCEPFSDYNTMIDTAKSFAEGGKPFVFGSYFQRFPHMTSFTVFCGALMKVFGTDVFVIKMFSVIFKTIAVFLAGLLGKEFFGKKGLLTTSFIYAVFPADIFYTPVAATENFALTFLLFSFLFYIKAFKEEDNKKVLIYSLICGAVLSLGCLLRGVAPFYFAAYFAGILLLFGKIRKKLLAFTSIIVSFFIIFQTANLFLFYSGITDYKLSDKGEPYTVYMLVGFNFDTNGMYSGEDHGVYLDAGENPQKASSVAIDKLVDRIRNNKEKIIPLFLKKTDIIWSDGSFNGVYWSMVENGTGAINPSSDKAQTISNSFYYMLLIMSLFTLIFYKKRKLSFMQLLLLLAFEGGLMLMEIQPRYTFSCAYIFVLMSATGYCLVYDFVKQKFFVKR